MEDKKVIGGLIHLVNGLLLLQELQGVMVLLRELYLPYLHLAFLTLLLGQEFRLFLLLLLLIVAVKVDGKSSPSPSLFLLSVFSPSLR